MLREFIKCNSTAERIQMIQNSVPADWSESELETVAEIVGASEAVKGMSIENALEAVKNFLNDIQKEELEDDSTIKEISRLSDEEAEEEAAKVTKKSFSDQLEDMVKGIAAVQQSTGTRFPQ
ncbi:MAG: hypothetical protein J6B85_06565 [Lachnospiraceae bacterium]|nr:hypothetical protein [Lachnospiraceae bacterium]